MPRRLFPAAVLFALTSSATAADWTQFRGPGGLGVSAEKGLPVKWGPQQNLAWKTELPGAGTSSPVFLGDRIFITSYTGYNVPRQPQGRMENLKRHVLCLDRKTGRVVWNKDYAPK